MFSDNFLPYVDEITICLLGSNIQNELYIIPVSTAQSTYESIIKIEKLDEIDVQKINFEIRYSNQINRNWNTKNIVVFWKNKVHYCKREKISSFYYSSIEARDQEQLKTLIGEFVSLFNEGAKDDWKPNKNITIDGETSYN